VKYTDEKCSSSLIDMLAKSKEEHFERAIMKHGVNPKLWQKALERNWFFFFFFLAALGL
jgi:hypothetical protein